MSVKILTEVMDPWSWWRDQMPIAKRFAYFDHAAVAPISGPAASKLLEFATQAADLGDTVWPSWNSELGRLRQQAAEMLHAEPGEVCLVPNTTAGINLVAEGWPWQRGDNVVIPDGEFPSNLFPWMNQAEKGVELRVVPRRREAVSIDDLLASCDDSTRIIAASWVGYASGYRIDVDDLVRRAHQRGIAVCLDAIQGLGIYPLDLARTPVDFLAADGHKWLLGPEGVGVAVIRGKHHEALRTTNVGWASVKDSHNYSQPKFELRADATRFESGSANMAGAGSLTRSMQIFLDVLRWHGPNAIEKRVIGLASRLNQGLLAAGASTLFPMDSRHQSGIVNFQVPQVEPIEFRKLAIQKDVVLSCRGEGVRASVHAYNNEADIQRLLDIVHGCC